MSLVIKIRGIVRNFPLGNEVVKVLKGIDLDIKRGEYVALMGPSGSGKSTLMNLLGCLDTPTDGTYELNGKDVSNMSQDELAEIRNKEIGYRSSTNAASTDVCKPAMLPSNASISVASDVASESRLVSSGLPAKRLSRGICPGS